MKRSRPEGVRTSAAWFVLALGILPLLLPGCPEGRVVAPGAGGTDGPLSADVKPDGPHGDEGLPPDMKSPDAGLPPNDADAGPAPCSLFSHFGCIGTSSQLVCAAGCEDVASGV